MTLHFLWNNGITCDKSNLVIEWSQQCSRRMVWSCIVNFSCISVFFSCVLNNWRVFEMCRNFVWHFVCCALIFRFTREQSASNVKHHIFSLSFFLLRNLKPFLVGNGSNIINIFIKSTAGSLLVRWQCYGCHVIQIDTRVWYSIACFQYNEHYYPSIDAYFVCVCV